MSLNAIHQKQDNERYEASLPFDCNACGSGSYWAMANLGPHPLSNNYLRSAADIPRERRYPLTARVCSTCYLCQVDRIIEPTEIFSHYAYFSSFSTSWVEHAYRYVQSVTQRFGITRDSLVIEVASNDGYLLQHFVADGVPVLGIEPAENIAKVANQNGIRTVSRFMGERSARELIDQGFLADLIVANNVLAHVPNLNDFIRGLRLMLKSSGVLTVEFHHLLQLLAQGQFDTIYHEHFSYLSLNVVRQLFAKHDLTVFDVEELSSHGGSLRVYAYPSSGVAHSVSPAVEHILEMERDAGLMEESTYSKFHQKIRYVREDLVAFLTQAKADRKSIVAYGAAAKGNTLLNYCNLTSADLAYVIDKNPHKQGYLLPGSHIPIVSPERLRETRPDFVLILPWNLAHEIALEHDYIRQWGGRFVTPVPHTRILS